jgi:hypothetical protein
MFIIIIHLPQQKSYLEILTILNKDKSIYGTIITYQNILSQIWRFETTFDDFHNKYKPLSFPFPD